MKKLSIIAVIFLTTASLFAFDWDLSHQVTFGGRLFEESSYQDFHLNADYKPDLFVTFWNNENFSVDTELSMKGFINLKASEDIDDSDIENMDLWSDLEFYRSWLRFSAAQYEIRAGLQKINFGTAQILRPLQWFDTIDPTDPQKISEGVKALLFRYYFLNNANLWLWAVDPNDNVRDNMTSGIKADGYEFGGRIQYPFKYCDGALSYHRREVKNIDFDLENRFGFDCRWDFEIGLWIETMYSTFSNQDSILYNHLFTVGADYTFPVGNGIYALSEHMFLKRSLDDFPTLFQESFATSLMLSYPIGMLDSASAIINYDWISENFFYYLSYSRSYDYISFYLNLFMNPKFEDYPISSYREDGKSIQLLVEIEF